tara:strand:- start:1551 stop:2615 length:1065 start_codon:yes stop_codon:yes gene_type:complete
MKLRTLYKRTKTGAVQVCSISVKDAVYAVEFGQLDGKLQTKYTECFPKNVGKSNESTAEGQAFEEANSKWEKKVKSGYSEDIEAPVTVQLPQKVKVYLENKDKIDYPAYSVLKLNGMNGTYWLLPSGKLKLTSRGGNDYPAIPHLEAQVRSDMALANTTSLNVELYTHGEHLQDISSAVKKTKESSKRLTLNTFELPLVPCQYKDKVETIRKLSSGIEIVEVKSEAEADAHYKSAMSRGYEGTVLYNKRAVYAFNERSSDVYKYKIPKEAEFKIVGFKIDKNKHVVYTCMSEGGEFGVKRKGTNEERLTDASVAASNIGRWLTAEYEMLSKSGIPLKPVGLDFRLCDETGEPLE